MCDRVAVMYAGEIVEQTDVRTLFASPKHPYTRGLIGAVPVPGVIQEELAVIPGSVPNLIALPEGCRFAPRCASRVAHNNVLATELHPELRDVTATHQVRCWLYHHADGSARPDPDTWPEAALPDVPDVAPALDIPEGALEGAAVSAAAADG
jgi:oligopeptide/dipeptide ABC transporter ATP-binding protein